MVSASIVRAMNTELDALENKIEQVVALVHQLRAENEVLKNQMAAAEAERLHLRQTMTVARERLEGPTEPHRHGRGDTLVAGREQF